MEGVTVAKVDENRKPVPGTERYIACDLLVLSVGLIPENELSTHAGIAIDPITKGPVVDDNMMTSIPGIFAAGNVGAVFDLVDYVSQTGEQAAEGVSSYLQGELDGNDNLTVKAGTNVSFVFPQQIGKNHGQDSREKTSFYLRVRKTMKKVTVTVYSGTQAVYTKRENFVTPPEMVCIQVPLEYITDQPLTVAVE